MSEVIACPQCQSPLRVSDSFLPGTTVRCPKCQIAFPVPGSDRPRNRKAKATIRLSRREVEEGDLPDVCLQCGAPATTHKSKNFRWYPPWVNIIILAGLLPFLIIVLVLTKRMRMAVPFCERHKYHWLWRNLVVIGLTAFLGIVFFVGLMVTTALETRGGNDVGGIFCMAWLVLAIAWLVVAIVLQTSAIRPTEITDHSITLTKVSGEFVEAIENRTVLPAGYPDRPYRD